MGSIFFVAGLVLAVIVFSFCCGAIDRLRGDSRGPGSFPESMIYGVLILMSVMPDSPWWVYLLFGALWAVGEAPGTANVMGFGVGLSNSMGPDYEWWQLGSALKNNVWAAAAIRGLMWGLPTLPLCYFDWRFCVPTAAMTIAFPAAIWLPRNGILFPTYHRGEHKSLWGSAEWFRGAIVGLLCSLFSVYFTS